MLSFPFRLRYLMAWNHELTLKLHRIFWRCLEKHYRKKAEAMGVTDGKTGGITVIQRAGDALNLNPHFHHSVLDGVFTEEGAKKLRFHHVNAPTSDEVREVTRNIRKRTLRMLGVERLVPEEGQMDEDPLAEEYPVPAAASAASVQSLVAFGERAGRRVLYAGEEPDPEELEQPRPRRKRHARLNGFDLHAGPAVPATDRVKLEKLQRYLLRPPVPYNRRLQVGLPGLPGADGSRQPVRRRVELRQPTLRQAGEEPRRLGRVGNGAARCFIGKPRSSGREFWISPRRLRLGRTRG